MSATVDNLLTNSTSALDVAEKQMRKSVKKDLDMYSCSDEQSTADVDITDDHTSHFCKGSELSVHRILQSNSMMNTDDLVGSSSILLNDVAVINSSQSSAPNTLILTSVFNSAPIMTVGESSKSDVSLGPKVNPSNLLLPKTERVHDHDDLAVKEGGSVLTSSTQTTFLLPSYYDSDHLLHVSPNTSVPLYQNPVSSSLYDHLTQVQSCQWQNCMDNFLTVDELVNHINAVHISSKDNSEYSCKWKDCVRRGKGFNARYKMLIHMRTHTGEKPHKCTISMCDKRFSRLENLKIHIRSHTGEKPYACHYEGCEKRYSNSSDRFKHSRTHIESKPYRCKVEGCFKQYTDPSSLRKHLKAHKLGGTVLSNSSI